jgi:hypothetical protein
LGDRQALGWVLRTSRMAFPSHRASLAARLAVGDRLLLYTTRGCFYNPTRDRGRVIGDATATTAPARLTEPVVIAGREFAIGCQLRIDSLVPKGQGPELAELRERLDAFSDDAWSVRLRTPLVPLSGGDAELIRAALAEDAVRPQRAIGAYLAAARPPNPAYQGRRAAG